LDDSTVIEGLIQPGTVTVIVGRSGEGKSPLVYEVAITVGEGVQFLGLQTGKGTVCVFDYENHSRQIAKMCKAISQHLGLSAVPNGLRICIAPSESSDVESVIREERPKLAIIDGLATWQPEAEERNATVTKVMKGLRMLAVETGCAIIVVHHIRKQNSNPHSRPDPLETSGPRDWLQVQTRGVSGVISGSDIRIGIDRCTHREDALAIRGYGRVDGELPHLCVRREFNEAGEPMGYTRLSALDLLTHDDHEFLEKLAPKFTFKQAKYASGKSDQPTRNRLIRLISARVVRQTGRGEYTKVEEFGE